jgi:hypothetical protein
MSSFTKPLIVKVHAEPLRESPFEVIEEFEFYSDIFEDLTVSIEKGYRTNFASVPRIFWAIIPPIGRYSKATVVHDWLIDNIEDYDLTIHQVNRLFKEAMEVSGVNWFYRNVMFLGVEFYWHFGIYISDFIRKLIGRKIHD